MVVTVAALGGCHHSTPARAGADLAVAPDGFVPSDGPAPYVPDDLASATGQPTRGFPHLAPWVSFYGTAAQMGDLAMVAATFRIINIDADPSGGNFTVAQLAQPRAGR